MSSQQPIVTAVVLSKDPNDGAKFLAPGEHVMGKAALPKALPFLRRVSEVYCDASSEVFKMWGELRKQAGAKSAAAKGVIDKA